MNRTHIYPAVLYFIYLLFHSPEHLPIGEKSYISEKLLVEESVDAVFLCN